MLTARSAFVVQIEAEPDLVPESAEKPLAGRVEHVISGQSLVFDSAQTLLEFLRSQSLGR